MRRTLDRGDDATSTRLLACPYDNNNNIDDNTKNNDNDNNNDNNDNNNK